MGKKDKKWAEKISAIKEHFDAILDAISHDQVYVYCYLQHKIEQIINEENGNIQKFPVFKYLFACFYKIKGYSKSNTFIETFYRRFSNREIQQTIQNAKSLDDLSTFIEKNLKFGKRHNYVYLSKMIHTLNQDFVLIDNIVREFLNLGKFDNENYIDIYKEVQEFYEYIINNDLLSEELALFEEKFTNGYISNLNDIKKLDFLFWSAGKIL